MKSYTDLEQSRKLAEILPLESADMCYILHASSDNPDWRFDNDIPPMVLGKTPINELTVKVLPCWSLTALLGVLPKQFNYNGLWWLQIDYIHNSVSYMSKDDSVFHYVLMDSDKSLVDACYEMIIRLNELNLL